MDHQEIKKRLSLYADNELDREDEKKIREHLKHCPECRQELKEMKKFEEVMGQMKFKEPPKEAWEKYWISVYNRLERRIGWILLSIGAVILLFFGGYKAVEGIIRDTSTPILLKIGLLVFLAGTAVMLVSLIREQFFVRKKERYKEVEK